MAQRTLLQLTTELAARGYDYLPTSRRKQFINDAIAELAESFTWPFFETTYTGTVPINMGAAAGVNYSRSVISVNDVTSKQNLPYIERAVLSKQGMDFAQTGTPQYWYWQGTTLYTYPMTTSTVVIEYIGGAKELIDDTDTIDAPMIAIDLIIDGAVIRALQDDDDYNEVAALRTDYDRRLGSLISSYAQRQVEPKYIVQVASDWSA